DASYPEETRVAVIKGKRLEEFDFETASKKPLKGNIYLAKVTRVEPSLQAAFVDYGGNRHGFLAFSEIHPDYYQIPIEDREALIAQERAAEVESAEAEEQAADAEAEHAETDETEAETNGDGAQAEESAAESASEAADDDPGSDGDEAEENDAEAEATAEAEAGDDDPEDGEDGDEKVDAVGGDAYDEVERPRRVHRRHYKIQEVIKRRQILLVQVVKEERGNKGAALTTYMSLAGRYCVLMPNTGRGGGISRKITSPNDRKRLKTIAKDLDVPDGMGVIVRTAGMSRNKSEIKRDFEYLLRIWDQIRELTLQSTAPCLVYEEANQIKRAIRDLYNKDIEEILIEGEEGYRTAKDFMRMLMPSHAKRVQPYKDRIPLFHRYQIEQQLDAMYSPVVTLPSGGYIVINSTEALVAIDVNSGKSTKEHNIEETALKTNTEAAEETARQLRLRDLAGLIVIDFIDMEVNRNNRAVERKLKECLKADRARIQVGRISAFGLLEMSRQRLRPGVHEVNMETCHHCGGTGVVRSTDSTALHVLRAIEEEGIRDRSDAISVHVPSGVAFYILN
ncbi:MAG: ribonuclease E/G, partial [Minwuiales bacterium]|nr:ribonuclease E/G [Minwuiales bacterium]